MKKLLLVLFFTAMGMFEGHSQALVQTYVDRCTGQVSVFSVPINGQTVVAFYNRSKIFTSQDFQNGTLQAWLEETYLWWTALSPCSTSTTGAQATQQTTQQTTQQATQAATNAAQSTTNVNTTANVTPPPTSSPPPPTQTSQPTTTAPDTASTNTSAPDTTSSGAGTSSSGNSASTSGGSESSSSNPQQDTETTNSSSGGETSSSGSTEETTTSGSEDSTGGDTGGEESTEVETTTEETTTEESTTEESTEETSTEESTEESSSEESSENEENSNEETDESTDEETTEEEQSEESDESESEEESDESSEEESEEETDEEESESDEDEESEDENTEEESDDETEEEDGKKKKKKRNLAPPIVTANVLSQQMPTGEFTQAAMFGVSRSSLLGDKTYGASVMVYDNMNQFMLNLNYSKVSINKEGRVNRVYSGSIGGMKMFTTYIAMMNHSMVFMGKKGSVAGVALGTTITTNEVDVIDGNILFDNQFLGVSLTGFYTKPFQFNPKLTISPMLAVSSPFMMFDMYKHNTMWNPDIMIIAGSNFTYKLTQRFGLNLGINIIESSVQDFPTMKTFTIGGRLSF
jgi:hypothetical protein